MPEGAPGNPGAASKAPPAGRVTHYQAVREMQAKLHRWAGDDPSRRFGDLFNLVYDPGFLAEAWLRVRQNTGSRTPGRDHHRLEPRRTKVLHSHGLPTARAG